MSGYVMHPCSWVMHFDIFNISEELITKVFDQFFGISVQKILVHDEEDTKLLTAVLRMVTSGGLKVTLRSNLSIRQLPLG